MSYILDALSKSQKERERADVPTLTTQFPIAGSRRRAPGLLAGTGLAVLFVGAIVTAFALSGHAPKSGRTGGEASAPAPALPVPIPTDSPTSTHPQPNEQAEPKNLAVAAASANPVRDGARRADRRTPTTRREARLDDGQGSRTPEMTTVAEVSDPSPSLMVDGRTSPATQWLIQEITALDKKVKREMPPPEESPPPVVSGDSVIPLPPDSGQPPPSPILERAVALNEPPVAAAPGPPIDRGESVTALRDLPPETRSTLPRLEINVHTYSENRERRMVLINMKRYGEGDRLAEGPLIESITPTGVVLVYDRQRFSIPAR